MKYLLGFVLALFSFGTVAAPATSTLSWTAPTTRVDGTPLQATQIEEFRIYYGIDIGPDPLAIGPEYTQVSGENAANMNDKQTAQLIEAMHKQTAHIKIQGRRPEQK